MFRDCLRIALLQCCIIRENDRTLEQLFSEFLSKNLSSALTTKSCFSSFLVILKTKRYVEKKQNTFKDYRLDKNSQPENRIGVCGGSDQMFR